MNQGKLICSLTPRKRKVLKIYKENNGKIPFEDIAKLLNVTPRSLATLLSRLRAEGVLVPLNDADGVAITMLESWVDKHQKEYSMSKISVLEGRSKDYMAHWALRLDKQYHARVIAIRKILMDRKKVSMINKRSHFVSTSLEFCKKGKSIQELADALGIGYNTLSVKLSVFRSNHPEYRDALNFRENK